MRVLFGHDLKTDKVFAESIFECVKRDAYPPDTWKNPDYSQNFNRYVQVVDDDKRGFGVSAIGPAEYEMLEDEGLFITLFRSVGELGDWGYFPTPDAQLIKDELKDMEFDFYFDSFKEDLDRNRIDILKARLDFFNLDLLDNNDKDISLNIPNIDLGANLFSTIFRNEKGQAFLRIYNPSPSPKAIGIKADEYDILARKKIKDGPFGEIPPYEIKTYRLEL